MDYTKLIRPEISTLTKYVPGKPMDDVKKEYQLDKVIKLASNENPLGPSEFAKQAIIDAVDNLHIYPDGAAMKLRKALAEKHSFELEQVVLGTGLDELLRLISQTFLCPGEEAIISDLTFSVYSHSVKLMGGKTVVTPLDEDYCYDLTAMAKAITEDTKLIFIANPNNPTGTIVSKEQMDNFMEQVPEDVIVVLDEAYYEFVQNENYPDGMDYLRQGKTVIVMRTFSKIYGLAALRLGYALGPKDLIEALNLMRPVFNASSLAQVAALAALKDEGHVVRTVKNNNTEKKYLVSELKKLDILTIPSETNFIFVNLGIDARKVFVQLQKKGLIIRPMGPSTFARISIGTHEENSKLICELRNILGFVKEV